MFYENPQIKEFVDMLYNAACKDTPQERGNALTTWRQVKDDPYQPAHWCASASAIDNLIALAAGGLSEDNIDYGGAVAQKLHAQLAELKIQIGVL